MDGMAAVWAARCSQFPYGGFARDVLLDLTTEEDASTLERHKLKPPWLVLRKCHQLGGNVALFHIRGEFFVIAE